MKYQEERVFSVCKYYLPNCECPGCLVTRVKMHEKTIDVLKCQLEAKHTLVMHDDNFAITKSPRALMYDPFFQEMV
jgi:hypothetical protein